MQNDGILKTNFILLNIPLFGFLFFPYQCLSVFICGFKFRAFVPLT
jgi:hypothetical protein